MAPGRRIRPRIDTNQPASFVQVQPANASRNTRNTRASPSREQTVARPPHPNESESITIKRPRGPTRGHGLSKLNAAAGKKMRIEIDMEQGRPINQHQSAKLSNQLGVIARTMNPMPIHWNKKFMEENLTNSYDRLDQTLDVDNVHNEDVQERINNLLQMRTKDQRHRLKKHFMSFTTAEDAKRHKPVNANLSQQNWEELIDYWCNPKTKEVAAKNTLNRSKNKTPHNQGSRAFVVLRHEISANELNGEQCDRMTLYKRAYYNVKENRWTTDEAEAKYNRMKELLEEAEAAGSPRAVDDICDEVLGTKAGYIPGLGHGPKPRTKKVSVAELQTLQEQLICSQNKNSQLESEMRIMRETLDAHTELLKKLGPVGSACSSNSQAQW